MPYKNKVYIPPSFNYIAVYNRMTKELHERQSQEVISYDHFLKLWHTELSEFVVGKVSSFTKCSICTSLKEEHQMAANNHARDAVQQLRDLHMKHVELSRRHYHSCRERARADPSLEGTIIIDGMDQSKTNLPSLLIEDKTTQPKARLRTHLTGVLYHNDAPGGMVPYVYTDIRNIPHDSNLTMNILLKVICVNQMNKGQKLNVQMDNCYRENKNRFLLALGFLLVELDVYTKVEFNFLPVGHTHEDVDQLFSRITDKLRHKNVYTLDELHDLIAASYTPKVEIRHLLGPDLLDIKSWLQPHLKMIGNHSNPHHFLFQRVGGSTKMFYRLWCCDPWRPNDTEGHDPDIDVEENIDGLNLFKSIPDTDKVPDSVIPSLEKMDPDLQQDVKAFGRRMPDQAHDWWQQFFLKIELYTQPSPQNEMWFLKKLRETMVITTAPEFPYLTDVHDAIHLDCPEVIVGRAKAVPTCTLTPDFHSLKVGMMVAVYVPDIQQQPEIGEVVNRENQWIKIH